MKKIAIIIAIVWFITAFATTVWASGQITENEFKARGYLKGDLGLNYTATHVETQELTLKQHICEASNGEYCELLVNLAKCESSLNPDAIHVNTNGTVDMGLYQWNSIHFTGKITPSCALDVYCSTRAAVKYIKEGHGSAWVCWNKI